MGDATKLAFAVFLISCSSGGCVGGEGGTHAHAHAHRAQPSAVLLAASAESRVRAACGQDDTNKDFTSQHVRESNPASAV